MFSILHEFESKSKMNSNLHLNIGGIGIGMARSTIRVYPPRIVQPRQRFLLHCNDYVKQLD